MPSAPPRTRPPTAPALRSATFRTLLLSELISLIGDRLVVVALVALVYEQTRSAFAVGILMLLKAVPAVALGSLAGALVDRWNRKWVMVGSNLAQGMLALLIPLTHSLAVLFVASAVFYAFHHWPSVFLLFGTIGVNGNIIDASWQAIADAYEYHLLHMNEA